MTGLANLTGGDAGRIDYEGALAEAARYVARGDQQPIGSPATLPPLIPGGPLAGRDLRYPMPALDPVVRSR